MGPRRGGLDELHPDEVSRLTSETAAMRALLSSFVSRQDAILDAEIFEFFVGAIPPGAGGVVNDGPFDAQVSGLSIITGLMVITPVGTTLATLTLGEFVLPVQNTTLVLAPLQFKVKVPKRSLTYTAPANATIGSTLVFWGYAAGAARAPGRLG